MKHNKDKKIKIITTLKNGKKITNYIKLVNMTTEKIDDYLTILNERVNDGKEGRKEFITTSNMTVFLGSDILNVEINLK